MTKVHLDAIDRTLIDSVQTNARLSFAELGRRVSLSPPAVAERLRRLEEAGLITGYRAAIDPARLGYPITAYIRMRTLHEHFAALDRLFAGAPEVLEVHELTGEDTLLLKVACRTIPHLDAFILRLAPYGTTSSTVVVNTRWHRTQLAPAE